MLADLAIQLLNNQVDGGIHIIRYFLATEQYALDRNRYLNLLTLLGYAEQNGNLANLLEVAGNLTDTLLNIVPQCRSDVHIFSSNSECCHK